MSERARKYRNTARLRLAVQLAGLSLIACGADPYLVPHWYLFVLAGACVTWAGGQFIRPAGLAPARNRVLLSGSHRVRVTVLTSLALVLVVAGALALIAWGLNQSEPAVVQAVNAAGSGSVPPGQNDAYLWFGIILMGAGGSRSPCPCGLPWSTRTASCSAIPGCQSLYRHYFGDDALKLWTATFGQLY